LVTLIVNFLNGIVAYVPSPWDLIVNLISSICCLSVFFSSKILGGFSSINISIFVKAFGLGCFLNYLIFSFFIFKQAVGLEMIFVSISTLIFSYFVSQFHFTKVSINNLIFIDHFVEDPNSSLQVASANSCISIIQFALRLGHPTIYDFSLFNSATNEFSESAHLWFIFAKIVAIYPCQHSLLNWIFHTARSKKINLIYPRI
jgi:hypothetical protein